METEKETRATVVFNAAAMFGNAGKYKSIENGVTVFNTTPGTVWLEPLESFVITFTVNPAIRADAK